MRYISSKKGFTLIELILAMGIILVISSFLVPKFNGYTAKAQNLKVIDTGRQIYLAAMESSIALNGEITKEEITKSSKDLLGIDIEEATISGDDVSINYKVDNKSYCIVFSKSNNGFTIKNQLGDQIYPK